MTGYSLRVACFIDKINPIILKKIHFMPMKKPLTNFNLSKFLQFINI